MKLWRILLPISLWTVTSVAAVAQSPNWNFELSNPARSGMPGQILTYNGVITNATGSDLTLIAASLDFDSSVPSSIFEYDFTDDFLNTNGIIPISGYSGSIFYFKWLASAPVGTTGAGTVELLADNPADPVSIPITFQASVVPASLVPEPTTQIAWLLGVGFSMGLLWYRRRSRGTIAL